MYKLYVISEKWGDMRTGTVKKIKTKCVCFCKKCILEKKDQANNCVEWSASFQDKPSQKVGV